jgi:hypothetical protein
VGKPLQNSLGFDERLPRILFNLEVCFRPDAHIHAINAAPTEYLQFEWSRTANEKARFWRAFYDNL